MKDFAIEGNLLIVPYGFIFGKAIGPKLFVSNISKIDDKWDVLVHDFNDYKNEPSPPSSYHITGAETLEQAFDTVCSTYKNIHKGLK